MNIVKNFLSNYLRTILVFFAIISLLYYPEFVSYLDCFKGEVALKQISASIVFARTDKHPNVKASLPDGSIEYFDFPSTYFGIRGWGPSFLGKVNEGKLKMLVGTNVLLKVSSTRYALFEKTLKIRAIHGDGIDLSFNDIAEAQRKFYLSTVSIFLNVVGLSFQFSF